ncbi:MAG TPA: sialidase family protein [Terriglobales bacterium]|nr:sialidase family protein [Terriglobales bacterium]
MPACALGALLAGLMTFVLTSCSGSSSSSSSSTSTTTQLGNPIGANLTQISSDGFTVGPGQHATEVEPHMLANGTMLVAAFQVGRIAPSFGPGAGATDIGWATSTDGGNTWTHGSLPGLTVGEGSGPYDAASDPEVAYDAKHGVWMIASLPIASTQIPAVMVSRSTDGVTWQNPVSVDATAENSDKNWIVCDTWASSPYYGNCYVEWDNPDAGDQILMSTSSDGGMTWGAALNTANLAGGLGGQPLVQPNGNVVVPIGLDSGEMAAFSSSNGGASWTATVAITQVQVHNDAGGIRSGPLPTAAIDGAGTVWVMWEDCRFRANCATNDLVYSTSADGVTWSAVTRVPVDDVSTAVDHFIPGLGIDPATSGAGAHVGIHFYEYAQSNCTQATCLLSVNFISSANGGSTWNAPVSLTGPMLVTWLPQSQNGLMVGDYIATAFTNGVPHGVFAVATALSGTTFNEAMYTGQGLTVTAAGRQYSSANDKPLHKLSDRIERERPEKGVRPPARRSARKSAK